MNFKTKNVPGTYLVLLAVIVTFLFVSQGDCQDTSQLFGQIAETYIGNEMMPKDNSIAGFSFGGLFGGILFGCIGFVAFIYGKKNAEFKPMIIGILLMGYPYFVRNTIALYLVGVALTVVLFIWRE